MKYNDDLIERRQWWISYGRIESRVFISISLARRPAVSEWSELGSSKERAECGQNGKEKIKLKSNIIFYYSQQIGFLGSVVFIILH